MPASCWPRPCSSSSQPADAAATLEPALKGAPTQDAQLLALAGESYMQVRDFSKASTIWKKRRAGAQGGWLYTSLGLSRLAQGDQARGLSELEMATSLDPKSTQATMALVQTEMA
jgi:Flp pilus assembly protein TadD